MRVVWKDGSVPARGLTYKKPPLPSLIDVKEIQPSEKVRAGKRTASLGFTRMRLGERRRRLLRERRDGGRIRCVRAERTSKVK